MIKLEVILGDITKLNVDAIVNAANSSLMGGGGVDGAIHMAAGPELLKECILIAESRRPKVPCPTGDAVITGAGKLNVRHIIHTVGPVWQGGTHGEDELLSSCYRNSLLLANEAGLESIAFPNVSTGIYGFPKKKAAEIAINTVKKMISELKIIKKIIFVCFDNENYSLYQKLL